MEQADISSVLPSVEKQIKAYHRMTPNERGAVKTALAKLPLSSKDGILTEMGLCCRDLPWRLGVLVSRQSDGTISARVFAYEEGKPPHAPEAAIEATLRGESNAELVELFLQIGRRVCGDADDTTGHVLAALMHLCSISKGELAKLTCCSVARIDQSEKRFGGDSSTMKILAEYVKGKYKKSKEEKR